MLQGWSDRFRRAYAGDGDGRGDGSGVMDGAGVLRVWSPRQLAVGPPSRRF